MKTILSVLRASHWIKSPYCIDKKPSCNSIIDLVSTYPVDSAIRETLATLRFIPVRGADSSIEETAAVVERGKFPVAVLLPPLEQLAVLLLPLPPPFVV